jgi:hypothetical protein
VETVQAAMAVAIIVLMISKEKNKSNKKYPEHIAASDIFNLFLTSFDFKIVATD